MEKLDCFLERYPLFRYIPGLILLAMIFRTSAISGDGMTWLVAPFDKFVHGGVYAVLGACFCLWFANARWEKRSALMAFCAALLCLAFGVLDEFHQSFVPGRSVSAGDVCADFVGGLVGAFVYRAIRPWKRFRIFREETSEKQN